MNYPRLVQSIFKRLIFSAEESVLFSRFRSARVGWVVAAVGLAVFSAPSWPAYAARADGGNASAQVEAGSSPKAVSSVPADANAGPARSEPAPAQAAPPVPKAPGKTVAPAAKTTAPPPAQAVTKPSQSPSPAAGEKAAQPESGGPAAPGAPAGGAANQPNAGPPAAPGAISFNLENADLLQFVHIVASELKMNYVVDPSVKGAVTITTMGNLRQEDLMPILQSVLQMNGATAVQIGNFYRIVPLPRAPRMPAPVLNETSGKPVPETEQIVMVIFPLRFVFATDMAKMLTPFLSDAGSIAVHEGGNVLILMDDSLNVKRLISIVEQFDSASFARQRIRLIPVHNNVASGLVPELDSIFSAYALSEKKTPLRFVALDRINSILVVTADPSAFDEVESWVEKLDQPAVPSGIQTFVYKVKSTQANYLARLLTNIRQQGQGSNSLEAPGAPGGGGSPAAGSGSGGGDPPQQSLPFRQPQPSQQQTQGEIGGDIVSGQTSEGGVRITTDPVNNSLIIQATAEQYAQIAKTLEQLDVMPREVMIQARVYEVNLTGDLSFGVEYFLQQRDNTYRKPLGSFSTANNLVASVGTLIGQDRELLTFLNASENHSRVHVLSAPTVLATDNSEAKIQVGSEVPILTSQGVVPVQSGGSSLFSNTVTYLDTGIILDVTPRITSTGLVSLKIHQEISSAEPPASGGIQSPSILKREIQTDAVVGNGQTVALGGLISDTVSTSKNRIPLLGDIPGLGVLFGSTSYSRLKTELIVLLTPHIVNNVKESGDATQQLQDELGDLKRAFKNDAIINH